MKVVILGPGWGTMPVLNPMFSFVEKLGHQVTVARCRGHYGDKVNLDGVTLADYEKDALAHIRAQIEHAPGEKVLLIGISMGAVIAHRIADKYGDLIQGVIMYGTPMISKIPVLSTALRILLNKKYRSHIRSKKGSFTLDQRDIEDLLFSGYSGRTGIQETLEQPESAKAVREMLSGRLKPNQTSHIPHVVLTCQRERFHRNNASRKFAKKQGRKVGVPGMYAEIEGGHFDVLFTVRFFDALRESIDHISRTVKCRSEARQIKPSEHVGTHMSRTSLV